MGEWIDLFAEENEDLLMAWIVETSIKCALEVLSEQAREGEKCRSESADGSPSTISKKAR